MYPSMPFFLPLLFPQHVRARVRLRCDVEIVRGRDGANSAISPLFFPFAILSSLWTVRVYAVSFGVSHGVFFYVLPRGIFAFFCL